MHTAMISSVFCRRLACAMVLISTCALAEQRDRVPGDVPERKPKLVYAQIETASSMLRDGVYRLNCRSQLTLPDQPEKALGNGLPLEFILKMTVERARSWWFDEVIARASTRFRIEYHQLSQRYRVTHLGNGRASTHATLPAALRQIGSLSDFPLIEAQHLDTESEYTGSLLLALDTEALPLPLRPQALLSTDWQLASETYTWPIR